MLAKQIYVRASGDIELNLESNTPHEANGATLEAE